MDVLIESIAGCPPAPPLVRIAARKLIVARTGTASQVRQLGPLELLPRPWLPHTCHPSLLRVLLLWLDDMAGWLNHDYTWRITRRIPDCWPEHPHIVHELAVVAWLRLIAEEALDPGPMEDWHRYALPAFYLRLTERLGNSCGAKHEDYPGRSGHTRYRSAEAIEARQAAFAQMVGQQQHTWERTDRSDEPEQLELPEPIDLDTPD